MEAKTFGALALGFSAGALCMCVLLWSGGALRSASELRTHAAAPPPPAPSNPNPPPAPEPITGVIAPSPLMVPVQGVDVHQLIDSFGDARDGRRHEAMDIPAPRGTPVVAAVEGNVAKLFHSKQGGNTV